MSAIELMAVEGLPEIKAGDQLGLQIFKALQRNDVAITAGDILVVTQKVVSKAEGRLVQLTDVEPSVFAKTLALERGADPHLIELILRESRRIVRMSERVIITETHHGWICANAGIDQSNLPGEGYVSLLPVDPDASAYKLQHQLVELTKTKVAVIITDTVGRPWREGLLNVCIGLGGINPLNDLRHQQDDYGKLLKATILATADEIAAASGLVMRKTRRIPVVLVRGVAYEAGDYTAQALMRNKENDLFR